MGVTPREIVDKVFTKSFRGYDEEEVDLFLDEIIKELESKNREIQAHLTRISELTARMSAMQHIALPPSMNMVQRSAEEYLMSANMKARVIVQQGEQAAQAIHDKAEEEAAKRLAEADKSARAILERARHEAAQIIQKAQRDAIGFTGVVDERSARERLSAAAEERQSPASGALLPAHAETPAQKPGQEPEGLPPFDPAWGAHPAATRDTPPLPPGAEPESAPPKEDARAYRPEEPALDLGIRDEDEFIATLAKLGINI